MNSSNLVKQILHRAQKLSIFCVSLVMLTLTWMGVGLGGIAPANALTIHSMPSIVAENPLNAIFGSGTSEQIEGKAEQDIGTVKRNVGKVQGQVEGAVQQAKGKVKKDIGTVKNKADRIGSELEDAPEDLRDIAEDLFNK